MRLKKEVLRKRCHGSLSSVNYLDLSCLDLFKIEKLQTCKNLRWLNVSGNKLEFEEGLEKLQQLWYLDLSNNYISYFAILDKFLALGTLVLTNNSLGWPDLGRLRHGHFLSISLHGNPKLDADPYYRIHVIDCLPLIWELDGRLVTVTERYHVKQFFVETQLTDHPVRHKVFNTFKTSTVKDLGNLGIVSQMCKYIYSKFPMSETHTKHTDERRLKYLTGMTQEDLDMFAKQKQTAAESFDQLPTSFLIKVLENRKQDAERCNMVLLLLVISLQYEMPTALLSSVLNSTRLKMIGSVPTMPIFLLPKEFRIKVIQILLNAAKVDRDNNVRLEGGLYPQLFMCLYHAVGQLTQAAQTSPALLHTLPPTHQHADSRCLMASEVVSLLVQLPQYFSLLPTDPGLANLTVCAMGGVEPFETLKELLSQPGPSTHEKAKQFVLDAISKRLDKVNVKMVDIPVSDRYLALSDSLPIRPGHSVVWACNFLSKGMTVPDLQPPSLKPRSIVRPQHEKPETGDNVLLGPQVVGQLTMIMQGNVGLVRIDNVPVSSGAMESRLRSADAHYSYVDLAALTWVPELAMWRPKNMQGDRYTTTSVVQRPASAAAGPLIYTPRTQAAQGPGQAVAKVPPARPSTCLPRPSTRLSTAIGRRIASAGNQGLHNNSFSNFGDEIEEFFPQVDVLDEVDAEIEAAPTQHNNANIILDVMLTGQKQP